MNLVLETLKLDDIPLEPSNIIEEIYSLHNKVFDTKEWYMHSKSSRQKVLSNLNEWLNKLTKLVNMNVRVMSKDEKKYLLTIHNLLIPENKETTYSCASCRTRMCRRLKDKFNV